MEDHWSLVERMHKPLLTCKIYSLYLQCNFRLLKIQQEQVVLFWQGHVYQADFDRRERDLHHLCPLVPV